MPSDALRKEYLNKLQGQINAALKQIEKDVDKSVRSSMTSVATATVKDAQSFAQGVGLSVQGSYSHVPMDIVQSVASGQLYEGNWSLSKALWLNTKDTQKGVQGIVAKGIIENKSAYDIAKDLEKYVDPGARKPWDWGKVYPGCRRVIDYNAQRLARTMVSHAYQQAFVRTTQNNPFVTKYQWEASNSERTCQLCMDRDGLYFSKDDLPLDHPNGMCTYVAVIEDDMNAIADRLADWANGAEDSALDDWAKDMYGDGWQEKKQDAAQDAGPVTDWRGIEQKWGIPCSDRLPEDVVKNLDGALTYMTDTYGRDFLETIPRIGSNNPANMRSNMYVAYHTYFGADPSTRGIYVNDKYLSQLTTETWVHEMGHALNSYLAVREGAGSKREKEIADSIISNAFKSTGHKLRKGQPSKKDIANCVSKYAATNNFECLAEAVANVYGTAERGWKSSPEDQAIHEELMKLLRG